MSLAEKEQLDLEVGRNTLMELLCMGSVAARVLYPCMQRNGLQQPLINTADTLRPHFKIIVVSASVCGGCTEATEKEVRKMKRETETRKLTKHTCARQVR